MKNNPLSVAALICLAILGAGPASSHHSISVIDLSQAVWVSGTVVKYRPGAPHALLEVDAADETGRRQRWVMEGPFPGRMSRIIALYGGSAEAYLKPGDRVQLCGFRPKAQYPVERSYADPRLDRAHFIHAQLMVMPDGQMRAWGPYGKLDHCVRPGDRPETWRDFLNRDPLAHDLWCSGLGNRQIAAVTPKSFVDEVHRGLTSACR